MTALMPGQTDALELVSCPWKHPSNLARAVGRFNPDGPTGYRGDYDGAPLRPTREQAEQDACNQHMQDDLP